MVNSYVMTKKKEPVDNGTTGSFYGVSNRARTDGLQGHNLTL